jgi:hypothetical protein
METLGLSKSTPKSKSRFKEFFAPDLSSAPAAKSACDSAAIICFVIAGVTTVWAIFTSPLGLIDAALFALIGIGLRRASRFAAVAGLSLYIAEQIAMIAEASRPPGILAILFVALLINGVRAAFVYQRIQAEQQKQKQFQTLPPQSEI